GVEDLDDVVAADVGGDLGLLLEAPAQLVVLEDVREHDLEGPSARGLEVDDLVDLPHAAHRDAADDTVAPRKEGAVLEGGGHAALREDTRRRDRARGARGGQVRPLAGSARGARSSG